MICTEAMFAYNSYRDIDSSVFDLEINTEATAIDVLDSYYNSVYVAESYINEIDKNIILAEYSDLYYNGRTEELFVLSEGVIGSIFNTLKEMIEKIITAVKNFFGNIFGSLKSSSANSKADSVPDNEKVNLKADGKSGVEKVKDGEYIYHIKPVSDDGPVVYPDLDKLCSLATSHVKTLEGKLVPAYHDLAGGLKLYLVGKKDSASKIFNKVLNMNKSGEDTFINSTYVEISGLENVYKEAFKNYSKISPSEASGKMSLAMTQYYHAATIGAMAYPTSTIKHWAKSERSASKVKDLYNSIVATLTKMKNSVDKAMREAELSVGREESRHFAQKPKKAVPQYSVNTPEEEEQYDKEMKAYNDYHSDEAHAKRIDDHKKLMEEARETQKVLAEMPKFVSAHGEAVSALILRTVKQYQSVIDSIANERKQKKADAKAKKEFEKDDSIEQAYKDRAEREKAANK